ncbi:type IV toxin-antitoxin system AbiEi family antitoxin domain-containing protein [Granulicatella seriolae]|uniref:Type IV toxin-antitoxin system AbiEi family antitoxin domain-containing protein n=1 Tax=Granulicatella seriolae TaxID=2967226 RepID=A0ABT1WQB5_9LACT|nr:type IV toxin-antitoxin system AbiEi family antitoxin domain-containing protein [Granulicatella seriolae]
MTNKDKILEIAKKNNGVVLTSQVTEAKIPRAVLINMVNEEVLFPVQRGIYVTDEGYVDDFYLLQARFPKGIFSHETTLYLQGFSDRAPIIPTMTFRYGTSTSRMKGEIRPVIVSSDFELGKIEIEKNGSMLMVYDVERTLVDMLKPRYDTDFEQFIPAIKRYAVSKNKDINKLFRYAQHFGLEVEMQKYIGGLL